MRSRSQHLTSLLMPRFFPTPAKAPFRRFRHRLIRPHPSMFRFNSAFSKVCEPSNRSSSWLGMTEEFTGGARSRNIKRGKLKRLLCGIKTETPTLAGRRCLHLVCLAGVGGFEPPDAGSKDPCLTAWRHPKHRMYGTAPHAPLRHPETHEKELFVTDMSVPRAAGPSGGLFPVQRSRLHILSW